MAGRRGRAIWAGLALLAAAAGCGRDEVEPLPPMQRPTPERRAGLPEIGGRWLFTGFEIEQRDSAAQANSDFQLVPPGEFRFLTQRLDSVAGQYGRPGQFVIPFTGEVRRDSVFALVAFAGDGVQQFIAGRVLRDTLWMELTNLASVERWPPRTRAAFVRRPRGAPFTRLLGGAPIVVPLDSATLDSIRRDSIRMDSISRSAAPPVGAPPAGQPVGPAPQPGVPVQRPAAPAPQPGVARPPVHTRPAPPRPQPQRPRPQPQQPPRTEPAVPEPQPPEPQPTQPTPTEGPPPPQEFPPPPPVPPRQ